MKLLQQIAVILTILWINNTLYSQQTITGVVNEYTSILSFSDCDSRTVTVTSTVGFSVGDQVLLIQMNGAIIDLTNSSNFGSVLDSGLVGNYELNRIKSISGLSFELLYKPINDYNINGSVQLVKVPEYDNVIVDQISCKPWDGTTGGVIALDVSGTLELLGNINASASGFRGGKVQDVDISFYGETEYFYSIQPLLASEKGEGIAEVSLDHSFGKGRAANGGGGGNAHNAGGAGGGNAGIGGDGGREYYNLPGSPTPGTNGIGGGSLFREDGKKVVLGGGGGSGHENDNNGTSGGAGGGIVILKANRILSNDNKIISNGEDVIASGNDRNDGQGGGGAGGTILINANELSDSLRCEAKGGKGGDCLFFDPPQVIGPGGGGGGGKIVLLKSYPKALCDVSGGINGIANQGLTNGATSGQVGNIIYGDTIIIGTAFSGPNTTTIPLSLCPNASVTVNGVTYTEPTTVLDTIPGIIGCDTIIQYQISLAPFDLVFAIDQVYCNQGRIDLDYTLCNLGSSDLPPSVPVAFYDADPTAGPANLLGVVDVLSTTAQDSCISGTLTDAGTILGLNDGSPLYAVVNFDGSLPAPFSLDSFPVTGIDECNYLNNLDSTTVLLPMVPQLDLGPDVVLCKDSTVVFEAGPGFASYLWQDGSVGSSFSATDPDIYWVEVVDSCGGVQRDSVLLTVSLLGDTKIPDAATCANEPLVIDLPGFDNYQWGPAAGLSCTDCPTVSILPAVSTSYTLLATTVEGCIVEDTFWVEILPLPELTEVIEFCPGETVTLAGQTFTQPGSVSDTIPNPGNCDIIITYQLQYTTAPGSEVGIDCIPDLNIPTLAGTGPVVVDYDLPSFFSTCPCPGVQLSLIDGLPSGSLFPVKKTQVCYEVRDSCGNVDTCCFNVIVREALPCDVKENDCLKYELLRITQNAAGERTYRIQVTNNCNNPMTYTAFGLPSGVVAEAPPNGSLFVAQPDDREYQVRNPNFSPMYSIRFKSTTDSISNGEYNILEYTLPPQSEPNYIHVVSRLEPQVYYEAYLNTFNCPVMPELKPGTYRSVRGDVRVFPNPTSGLLYADLSSWVGESVVLTIMDGTGQHINRQVFRANAAPQQIDVPEQLTAGLYMLHVQTEGGERFTVKFVLTR